MKRIALLLLLITVSGCGREQPKMAGSKWADLLHVNDTRVRRRAVFTLGNIGPSDPAVLPALIVALKDRDASVRREAILALAKYGPGAREALSALRQIERNDPDAQVRAYSAQARQKLNDGA